MNKMMKKKTKKKTKKNMKKKSILHCCSKYQDLQASRTDSKVVDQEQEEEGEAGQEKVTKGSEWR